MRCPPVRAAVQAISEAIGTVSFHVYDHAARERATDHPVEKLLSDRANEWTSASEFREQLQRDALLHGNGLAFINRVNGTPRELLRLEPGSVAITASDTGEPSYRVGQQIIPRANILHIKAPSLDGIKGESPVTQCREAIAICVTLERHCSGLFSNSARPSGVLSFKSNLTPEGLQKAREAWQAAHGGGKSGGTAVMPGDTSWTPLQFNSTDSQFLEHRRFAVSEIARAFRVPPHVLYDLERGTWSNVESMGQEFVTYSLMRWFKQWEGEIRIKLLDDPEHYAEFQLDSLLRANFSERMTGYSTAIAARILSPNEARSAENRAPYEGGDKFENPNTTSGRAAEAGEQ
jgi:HK97 family phage portal protein